MMMPILSKAGLSLGPGSLDALTEKEDSERYKPDGKEQFLATWQVLYKEEPAADSARAKLARIVRLTWSFLRPWLLATNGGHRQLKGIYAISHDIARPDWR